MTALTALRHASIVDLGLPLAAGLVHLGLCGGAGRGLGGVGLGLELADVGVGLGPRLLFLLGVLRALGGGVGAGLGERGIDLRAMLLLGNDAYFFR